MSLSVQGRTGLQGLGGALDLDGSDDFADAGSPDSLLIHGNVTLSVRIRPDSFGSNMGIIHYGETGTSDSSDTNNPYYLEMSADTSFRWVHEYGSGQNEALELSSNTIVTDQWCHITAVRNDAAKTLKFYKNGEKIDTASYSNSATGGSNAQFSIGRDGYDGGQKFFTGSIDDVRVYPYALTADQVKQIYKMWFGPDRIDQKEIFQYLCWFDVRSSKNRGLDKTI